MIGISGLYRPIKNNNEINYELPDNDTEFKFNLFKNKNLSINYLNKNFKSSHFVEKNIFSICLGEVEHESSFIGDRKASKILFEHYQKNKLDKFLEKNGNFIFLVLDHEKLIIGKSKNSIIPLFYYYDKKDFFFSYSLINIKSNINRDLKFNLYKFGQLILTNGVILDNETIFDNIKFLLNGEILKLNQNKISLKRKSYFTYYPEFKKIDYHINNVSNNLKQALKKLDNKKTFNLGLSGGIDSRILLAYLKKGKFDFQTHFYGMNNFDEVKIANKISKFYNCKHDKIIVNQKNYLSDSYMSSIISNFQCNLTTYPQRMIYKNLSKNYKNQIFLFGSALDCTAGDAWQSKETLKIKSKKKLIEYFRKKHVFKFDKNKFSNFFLNSSLSKNIYDDCYEKLKALINKINSDNSFDITSSFYFETRGKRWYNNSLIYPLYYCDIKSPFYDKDFLDSLSIIPSNLRVNDYFRVKLLESVDKKLSKIIYNKSMSPANFIYPLNKKMIKKASVNEEKKFRKWIKSKFDKKFSSKRYDANFREWLICKSTINSELTKYFNNHQNLLGKYFNLIYFINFKTSLSKKIENLKTLIIFLSISNFSENIKIFLKKNDK